VDRLDALRAFVLAVDRGSLAAVARSLGRSPASITRAIDSIEARLGTSLLARTTRSLKLTEAGERYLTVARRVLADLDEAEQSSSAALAEPQGLLTITAPIAFGALHLRPLVDDYLRAHANVRVRLLLLDRVVNLVEEGVDVALRIGQLPDSALLAVAMGTVRRVLVASPDYLARHGRPKRPADLARHRCIGVTGISPQDTWSFGNHRVRVRPIATVNLAEAAIRSAEGGIGVTRALSYQVAQSLKQGSLVRLLTAYEPPPLPVQIVYPASSARTAKLRAFVELAAPRLRAILTAKA
jgi:DNA-binding transcriptional LysR family regulator